MTFTEAAVEVLKRAGRPLHYKKITEAAIQRSLLSHVGKTPAVTMSSRLTTMVKRDRGASPIIKVKPGVFGLREFSAEIIEAALKEKYDDAELADEIQVDETPPLEEATPASAMRREVRLAGAEMFPEEDDDDEPIFGRSDEPSERPKAPPAQADVEESADERSRRRRKRRRRGKLGGEVAASNAGALNNGALQAAPQAPRAPQNQDGQSPQRTAHGDDLLGKDLADAIDTLLSGANREPVALVQIAERLVARGRLSGNPQQLVPTVAAAIRADQARAARSGGRERFLMSAGVVGATSWLLSSEARRAHAEMERLLQRQQEAVRRVFMRRLSELPMAGLVELLASWLNAEGVGALRGVRPEHARSGELHFAGVLRRGGEEARLGIVCLPRMGAFSADVCARAAAALEQYGQAVALWVITFDRISPDQRRQIQSNLSVPCAIFDSRLLSDALQRTGIGLRTVTVPCTAIDWAVLEGLGLALWTGEAQSQREGRDRHRSDEQGERDGRERRGGRRARRFERDGAAAQASRADVGEPGDVDGQSEAPLNADADVGGNDFVDAKDAVTSAPEPTDDAVADLWDRDEDDVADDANHDEDEELRENSQDAV